MGTNARYADTAHGVQSLQEMMLDPEYCAVIVRVNAPSRNGSTIAHAN